MTIGDARIRVDVQEQGRWRRILAITVPGALVRDELARGVKQLAARIKLPGFRKGRAPLAVVEREHGSTVQREVLRRVIGEASRAAVAEKALLPVSAPAIEDVVYEPGSDLTFRISFDVRPVVELTRLGGFTVERPAVQVTEEDVESAVERVREDHAIWRPAEDEDGPGDGDLVTVRIVSAAADGGSVGDVGLPWARRLQLREGTQHRGRYQFVLGAGDAIPGLEEAIRSLAPGVTKDFTVAFPGEAGATERRLRITLQERQVRELPELDEAFVRSLGDFTDLQALRDRIRRDLAEDAAGRAEAVLRERLLCAVLEANPFELPASMVERYLTSLAPEPTPDGVDRPRSPEDGLWQQAEELVRRFMVLDRIAQMHDLKATPAEVDARAAEIAASGSTTPAQVRSHLLRTNRLDELARVITDTKVFEFLKRQSEIVEAADPRMAPPGIGA